MEAVFPGNVDSRYHFLVALFKKWYTEILVSESPIEYFKFKTVYINIYIYFYILWYSNTV
jgi:hypothetical protein